MSARECRYGRPPYELMLNPKCALAYSSRADTELRQAVHVQPRHQRKVARQALGTNLLSCANRSFIRPQLRGPAYKLNRPRLQQAKTAALRMDSARLHTRSVLRRACLPPSACRALSRATAVALIVWTPRTDKPQHGRQGSPKRTTARTARAQKANGRLLGHRERRHEPTHARQPHERRRRRRRGGRTGLLRRRAAEASRLPQQRKG